jgi:hypothetical protein
MESRITRRQQAYGPAGVDSVYQESGEFLASTDTHVVCSARACIGEWKRGNRCNLLNSKSSSLEMFLSEQTALMLITKQENKHWMVLSE